MIGSGARQARTFVRTVLTPPYARTQLNVYVGWLVMQCGFCTNFTLDSRDFEVREGQKRLRHTRTHKKRQLCQFIFET
jgi:hypothetical protein